MNNFAPRRDDRRRTPHDGAPSSPTVSAPRASYQEEGVRKMTELPASLKSTAKDRRMRLRPRGASFGGSPRRADERGETSVRGPRPSFSSSPRNETSSRSFAPSRGASRPAFGTAPRRDFDRPQGDRPSFSRPPQRGGSRSGGSKSRFNPGGDINPSRFINRSVIEEIEVYEPTHKFADFALDDRLKNNVALKGYVLPTAIQDRAIPHVLEGADVIGIANTGEGKTAAFLLPLLHKVLHNKDERILVLVPTRELAAQIEEEFIGFSRQIPIRSVLAIGGVNIVPQIERLRRDVQLLIGTPGRIKDLVERRALDLSKYTNVVLDEADRMLDMGFIADIRYMIGLLAKERQTLLFSATFAREIESLARDLLRNPITISVKRRETSNNIDQDVIHVKGAQEKIDRLEDILRDPRCLKVLVFGRTKYGVEKLGRSLRMSGFSAVSIHGNKTQQQRMKALKDFKSGASKILVATDVAARGLDIPEVSHVINFDLPSTYEDYVHRIGRTGRAGKHGTALTFVD